MAQPRVELGLPSQCPMVRNFNERGWVDIGHGLSPRSRAFPQNAGTRPYNLLVQKEHDGEYPLVRVMNAKLSSHPEGIVHLIGPRPPPSPTSGRGPIALDHEQKHAHKVSTKTGLVYLPCSNSQIMTLLLCESKQAINCVLVSFSRSVSIFSR